jgi:bifunctional NMN adenylyltransferase/nudix hydrolase
MQPVEDQFDVGVLVGRFQVHELHQAHKDLIQYVCDRHEKVIIFLGLSPLSVSTSNPLDFEARKQMILAEFPEVNVLYIKDQGSDDFWSGKLDAQIADLVTPTQSVVLYGGRDSFISHYTGTFPTRELTQTVFYSGTEQRKAIAKSRAKASPEFRAGVIWASQARFPTAYTCVDVAILKKGYVPHGGPYKTQLLLGRKANERLYRFIGGFSDPRSASFEDDAKREVAEETGLEVGNLTYLGSLRVEDWRYRNEPDCIKTMLFAADYLHGHPKPADDIAEVKWFDLAAFEGVTPSQTNGTFLVPEHRPLMAMLRAHLNNRKESMR